MTVKELKEIIQKAEAVLHCDIVDDALVMFSSNDNPGTFVMVDSIMVSLPTNANQG